MAKRKVAVIGGGPVGLAAVKIFKENGYEVVGFETTDKLGGLWRYQDEPERKYCPLPDKTERVSGAYSSLVLNTSKELSCYSDFPFGEEYPTFLSHEQFIRYLEQYSSHFQVKELFKLNTHVCQVTRSEHSPYFWSVTYKEKSGEVKEDVFDKIVLATGAYAHVYWPNIREENCFQGTIIHSAQLRRGELFKDKTVVVLGGGYSGGETVVIAVEGGAKRVFWSLNRAEKGKSYWLLDRSPCASIKNSDCRSWDHVMTRANTTSPCTYKTALRSQLLPIKGQKEVALDLVGVTDVPIITSASIVHRSLQDGTTKLVDTVQEYTPSGVTLQDGTALDQVDIVVYCTGYLKKFPPLGDGADAAPSALYRHILPVEEKLQGVAFLAVPHCLTSSVFPTAEMQARWLASTWANRPFLESGSLFSESELQGMREEIDKRKSSLHPLEPYNILLETYRYMDTLAGDMGCLPPDGRNLTASDDELATALLHGPVLPAQYRLCGPHSWQESRNHIVKVGKEILGDRWEDKRRDTLSHNVSM